MYAGHYYVGGLFDEDAKIDGEFWIVRTVFAHLQADDMHYARLWRTIEAASAFFEAERLE